MIASTISLSPLTTLNTPSGRPAALNSAPKRTGRVGSRSDGFRMKALPVAMATPAIHIGIIAGKLNGVMPAPMPTGWRCAKMSMPGPAPWVYSPFSTCGMPQQNSMTSRPRWISPFESARTLPCSDDRMRASSSISASTSSLNLNITRARRCGLVAAQAGCASLAAATACSSVVASPSRTCAWTVPELGSNTSLLRVPEETEWPAIK